MKILKHGELKPRHFTCSRCSCEFVADMSEYEIFCDGFLVNCPECHATITENAPLYKEPVNKEMEKLFLEDRLCALNVAKYVINYSRQHGYKISNMELGHMLYLLWIEYYKITKKYLFHNMFYAWQLGPRVPEVYYQYCCYGANPISEQKGYNIDGEVSDILDACIDTLLPVSSFELYKITTKDGGAWKAVYGDGEGSRHCMRFDDIIALEIDTEA